MEGRALPRCIVGRQPERVDLYRPALALDYFSAAVDVVEAFAADLYRGGHRWDLLYLAGKGSRRFAEVSLVRERDVQFDYLTVGVEGVGGGAEAGGGRVGLVQARNVAGEASGASYEEDEETGGEGVEGAGVAYLGLLGEEAFDLGYRAGARDTRWFIEQQRAG